MTAASPVRLDRTADRLLRPVLNAATSPDPGRRLRAVLCKGIDSKLTPDRVRRWVHTTGDVDLITLTDQRDVWSALVAGAREHTRKGKTTKSRRGVTADIAHAVLHHITAPAPYLHDLAPEPDGTPAAQPTPAAWIGMRHLVLVVGHHTLASTSTSGWDTAYLSRADLTVPLGVGRGTASKRLDHAIGGRWVSVRAKGRGGKLRLRPRALTATQIEDDEHGLRGVAGQVAAVLCADVTEVDELREKVSPAARLMLAVEHPVWAYDPVLKPRHLLVALADALGAVDGLGLSARAVQQSRRELRDVLGWDLDGPPVALEAALNARASAAGVYDAVRAAYQRRAEEKAKTAAAREVWKAGEAERRAQAEQEAEQRRATKAMVRDRLRPVLQQHRPVPTPLTEQHNQVAWASALRAAVAGLGLKPMGVEMAAEIVAEWLRRAGWGRHDSVDIAKQMFT